jgi:hypothetical protein
MAVAGTLAIDLRCDPRTTSSRNHLTRRRPRPRPDTTWHIPEEPSSGAPPRPRPRPRPKRHSGPKRVTHRWIQAKPRRRYTLPRRLITAPKPWRPSYVCRNSTAIGIVVTWLR